MNILFSAISIPSAALLIGEDKNVPHGSAEGTSENKPSGSGRFGAFKLPIDYLDKNTVHPLSQIVNSDLELTTTQERSGAKSIYEYLFVPTHKFGYDLMSGWGENFTNDVAYLTETKGVVSDMELYKQRMSEAPDYHLDPDALLNIWTGLKDDAEFLSKYSYMEWEMLMQFNESDSFLQILSVMNIASPMVSLLLPVFLLLFPFIVLKIQGIAITFDTYLDVLKTVARNHFIGRALTSIDSISPEKLIYLFVTLGLYLFQIYQNIVQCNRFYQNIQTINNHLCYIRDYVRHSIHSMENFTEVNTNRSKYSEFVETTRGHCRVLKELYSNLETVNPFCISVSKFMSMGVLLRNYYQLFSNKGYEQALEYSFGFAGYIDNLMGVHKNVSEKRVSYAEFIDTDGNTVFKKQYYPAIRDEAPVHNDCSFDKNIIITGVNASGKTTTLKTTTINIIFTQQLGCGFYEACQIAPYTHIHSYLNIPDTSGRDSLFQAESRRCKEILDIIRDAPTGARHYCIFDELYSGTNPVEATKSAYAFLKYMNGFSNVDFILTTHYVSICKKLRNCGRIQNYKMVIQQYENGEIEYTYKMRKGISRVQGAIKILEQLDYPKEIIQDIVNYGRDKTNRGNETKE
jgi:hypothetical protein